MLPPPNQLNWDLQDIELADMHGVSRERIRQIRKLHGQPCLNRMKKRGYWEKVGQLTKYKDQLKGKNLAEISRITGIDVRYRPVREWLKENLGIVPVPTPNKSIRPFHLFDWRLSNSTLARIWGISAHLVSERRRRAKVGKAKKGKIDEAWITEQSKLAATNGFKV